MTNEIFGHWLDDVFLPETANLRTEETPVVLILDGFRAHEYLPTLKRAEANHVIIVRLPAHSTHLTQPLDLAVMGPMHTYLNAALLRWVKLKLGPVTPAVIIRCLAESIGKQPAAWDEALKPDNIRSGFRKPGIFPFNEHALDGKGAVEDAPEKENVTPLDMLATAALEPSEALLQAVIANDAPTQPKPPRRAAQHAALLTSAEHLEQQHQKADQKQEAAEQKAAAAEERKRKKETKAAEAAEAEREKKAVKRACHFFGESTMPTDRLMAWLRACLPSRAARPLEELEASRQSRAARAAKLRARRARPAENGSAEPASPV